MNEIIEKENISIENKVYEIRGVQVMLDSDLAELYHVETKRINESVNNNPEKFPTRFSWILDDNDEENLRSKFSTSSEKNYGGRRYNTRVFTEQGVYMLATILKSKESIKVSIRIMDTFVKMRHYINYSKEILPYKFLLLEEKVDKNTKRIDELFDMFDPKEIAKNYLFFRNDLYDAYSVLLDIFGRAKKEIIIIDNYAGKELLDVIRKYEVNFILVSKNIDDKLKEKYEKQYHNVKFVYNDSFHDRFIIVDKRRIYNCGSSFKDLGKKCFYIGEIEDGFIDDILNEIKLD